MVKAIVGANWGDEGKGKITDMFAEKADIVIRFQGGANAGHTIINDKGRFAFHLMPSGVCYDHTTCIIGNGVALDINKFLSELEDVRKAGLNPKLLVSDRVQILMPYHILFDEYEEERLGKNAFGSTKSGIAPFFSDKYAKGQICAQSLAEGTQVVRDTKIEVTISLGPKEVKIANVVCKFMVTIFNHVVKF